MGETAYKESDAMPLPASPIALDSATALFHLQREQSR